MTLTVTGVTLVIIAPAGTVWKNWSRLTLPVWAGSLGVLLAGVFVGMLASALEKILEVAPVLLRRFHIMDESAGIRWVMLVGKTVGALLGCLLYTL